MGTTETNSKLKGKIKFVREQKFYGSGRYQDFSEIINTKNYNDEEKALRNEIITSMTIFHSHMSFPSITTRVVHAYCFLSNPKLRKRNKVILIEFGPYYGFSETCEETPHYPCGDGMRYFFTEGYFNNGYDGLAVVHNEMTFNEILKHFYSQKWRSNDYHLTKHNCQDFIKELIILLEAELIHETIPTRCPLYNTSARVSGIYEIPTPVLDAFINVLEKKGVKYSFSTKIEGKLEKLDYNLVRLDNSPKDPGFRLICLYEYGPIDNQNFKLYYKDFIKFYEKNESSRKVMASFLKPFYLSFKNQQNDSKYKFY